SAYGNESRKLLNSNWFTFCILSLFHKFILSILSVILGCKSKVVLLSDGCPTDDYDEGIMELRNLQTFNDADKFAIALGDNADLQTLIRFVDVQENIFIENKADRLIDALNTIMGNITNYTSTPLHSDDIDDEWS
ncbi:hypothetical protein NE635_12220, partial [Phocaeicola vulgatus]|nr:hypothetical protein [Phocaeicola vulgatus]MCQ5317308.1 hypothetical protein [Phocaeicola vulgatus]MCQ5329359.1 hypothetical protein [Phocaeicola vulgatus]